MGVPGLEIWGRTVEHPSPHQHVLAAAMDLPLSWEGGGSSSQEEAAGISFGCSERLRLRGTGMRGRGVPQEGRGSLRGLLTKAPASVAESWES